jgi:hypothetical protein
MSRFEFCGRIFGQRPPIQEKPHSTPYHSLIYISRYHWAHLAPLDDGRGVAVHGAGLKSLIKLCLAGNNFLFPARENLVSDIPDEDRKIA